MFLDILKLREEKLITFFIKSRINNIFDGKADAISNCRKEHFFYFFFFNFQFDEN